MPVMARVLKRDLTPALNRLCPNISDDVEQAFRDEFPACESFTEINVSMHLLRVVAKVSGSLFVGRDLAWTEAYIDMAINYTVESSGAVQAILSLKPWKRLFKAKSLPEVRRLRQRTEEAYHFLRPLVSSRRTAAKIPGYKKPDDMVQWLMDDGQGELKDEELAEVQLMLTAAAIHTTSLTAINAFYTLAAFSEIVSELRSEISDVLAECETFTSAALSKMRKLVSFLRESVRCNPLSWKSFSRKVLKNVTLSDGQVIPAGCMIQVAADAVAHDPDRVPDPERFDAFRSYRARNEAPKMSSENGVASGSDAGNQLVTVGVLDMAFGYGRHACPSRFLAATELKLIIARALLDFDIKLADGTTGRYPNVEFAGLVSGTTLTQLVWCD
ncbi:hypothetical protein CPLU01_12922 [Colletotrichum plurivorum]|uniref:Ent-kaurene oxidase n=1 Tax=Colletotrichum plurivorum TaxID=2175906 RepID=A0A8H6JW73_9PEZI|nr:hypothetical protein CPLU01_12922 [Colletotrichum plurivorum]